MYRINAELQALTGYTMDELNALEALNTWSGERTCDFAKNIKIGLYNDVFIGIADKAITSTQKEKYRPAVEQLKALKGKGQYAYMFETAYALGEVRTKQAIKTLCRQYKRKWAK